MELVSDVAADPVHEPPSSAKATFEMADTLAHLYAVPEWGHPADCPCDSGTQ